MGPVWVVGCSSGVPGPGAHFTTMGVSATRRLSFRHVRLERFDTGTTEVDLKRAAWVRDGLRCL